MPVSQPRRLIASLPRRASPPTIADDVEADVSQSASPPAQCCCSHFSSRATGLEVDADGESDLHRHAYHPSTNLLLDGRGPRIPLLTMHLSWS
jgi:hypothetical protein